MTAAEYRTALETLGLKITGPAMQDAIGISNRMSQYYAAGRPIPPNVAKLVQALCKMKNGTRPARKGLTRKPLPR